MIARLTWAPLLLLLGCSRGGAPLGPDPADAAVEDAATDDGGGADLSTGAPPDLRGRDLAIVQDLRAAADLQAPPDLAPAGPAEVNIYVDNFCKMDVVPKSFTVPHGNKLKLTYRNRSVDYPVDVWLSYGGGFLDLKEGMTWADRFEHCATPNPYTAYADISTACSKYRLLINCL